MEAREVFEIDYDIERIILEWLGVSINHYGHSVPVSKVKINDKYPMSFTEFLTACGETMLIDLITNVDIAKPINSRAHKFLLEKFDMYLMVSSFPESVDSYISTGNVVRSFSIISDIHGGYYSDINKYANKTDALKI